ncbi:MAG: SRPBCC family protein [Oligoflexales bacterium]
MRNKIIVTVSVLFVLAIAYLGIVGSKVQEISTEIDIKASPDKVWEVLVNVEKWQDWSPIIKKSSGKVAMGEALQITMRGKEPEAEGPSYSPSIIHLDAPNSLIWRAHMMAGFVMTNDKMFELKENSSGGTKLIHKEMLLDHL